MDSWRDRDRERDRGGSQRDRRPPEKLPQRPDLGNEEQVKRLKRGMERSAAEVIRCQKCGHQQSSEAAFIGPMTTCDKCGTALHSCRHCAFFDSGARFQCKKAVPAAIGDKWAPNACDLYEPRLVLDATGKRLAGVPSQNNKSLFDSLFKK